MHITSKKATPPRPVVELFLEDQESSGAVAVYAEVGGRRFPVGYFSADGMDFCVAHLHDTDAEDLKAAGAVLDGNVLCVRT